MMRTFGRVAAMAALAVAAATASPIAGLAQGGADDLICQQIRALAGLDSLRKTVEDYKATEKMIGSLADLGMKDIASCKTTPRAPECAPEILDHKAGESQKLAEQGKKLHGLIEEIEARLKDADEKRQQLEAKLRDKSVCRAGQ